MAVCEGENRRGYEDRTDDNGDGDGIGVTGSTPKSHAT